VPTSLPRSHFASIASSIGRDIHRTSEKLARLAELAKTTSLFTEQTVAPQVQRLIGEVNTDIRDMAARLEELRREADAVQATHAHTAKSQPGEHASNVVSYLKLRLGETTTQFRDVLQTRNESLKAQQERRQRYAGTTVVQATRSGSSPMYKDSAILADDRSR
jgi:syntaxin 5